MSTVPTSPLALQRTQSGSDGVLPASWLSLSSEGLRARLRGLNSVLNSIELHIRMFSTGCVKTPSDGSTMDTTINVNDNGEAMSLIVPLLGLLRDYVADREAEFETLRRTANAYEQACTPLYAAISGALCMSVTSAASSSTANPIATPTDAAPGSPGTSQLTIARTVTRPWMTAMSALLPSAQDIDRSAIATAVDKEASAFSNAFSAHLRRGVDVGITVAAEHRSRATQLDAFEFSPLLADRGTDTSCDAQEEEQERKQRQRLSNGGTSAQVDDRTPLLPSFTDLACTAGTYYGRIRRAHFRRVYFRYRMNRLLADESDIHDPASRCRAVLHAFVNLGRTLQQQIADWHHVSGAAEPYREQHPSLVIAFADWVLRRQLRTFRYQIDSFGQALRYIFRLIRNVRLAPVSWDAMCRGGTSTGGRRGADGRSDSTGFGVMLLGLKRQTEAIRRLAVKKPHLFLQDIDGARAFDNGAAAGAMHGDGLGTSPRMSSFLRQAGGDTGTSPRSSLTHQVVQHRLCPPQTARPPHWDKAHRQPVVRTKPSDIRSIRIASSVTSSPSAKQPAKSIIVRDRSEEGGQGVSPHSATGGMVYLPSVMQPDERWSAPRGASGAPAVRPYLCEGCMKRKALRLHPIDCDFAGCALYRNQPPPRTAVTTSSVIGSPSIITSDSRHSHRRIERDDQFGLA